MKHRGRAGDRQRIVHEERSNPMSATASPQQIRQPIIRSAGVISAALIGIALVALTGTAVMTFVRENGPAVEFDPTGAQRSHLAREYGSAASYNASGALQTHLLRENHAAPDGILFDHVLRENDSD
jgi:hypothetical protein